MLHDPSLSIASVTVTVFFFDNVVECKTVIFWVHIVSMVNNLVNINSDLAHRKTDLLSYSP